MAKSGRGQLATALAAFVRRQAGLSLGAVAVDQQCLELADQIFGNIGAASSVRHSVARTGRKPVHDRAWAEAALFDLTLKDPDGLPVSQSVLANRLRDRFNAASLPVPSDSWIKIAVRRFYREAAAFETAALVQFRNSKPLQDVFEDEGRFMAFRRVRNRLDALWSRSGDLQGQYSTPVELLESILNSVTSPISESAELQPITILTADKIRSINTETTVENTEHGTQRIDAGGRRAGGGT